MEINVPKNAAALKVQHLTVQIPWSEPHFTSASVQVPRGLSHAMRGFHVLFHAMTRRGRQESWRLGHHADDQVETSLMRLAWVRPK